MSTLSQETQKASVATQVGSFLISLLVGLIVGGIVLGAGQFLLDSSALADTGAALGITEKTSWYFTRSAGTVAYLLLALSTVWGLLLSSKIIKETVPAVLSLAMHNVLAWGALGMTALHIGALLFDSYYTCTLADLFIPFVGPYRPEWVGLGIIGFYLMFITTLSFYWRKQLGQKKWRQLHYLTFVAFAAVTAHGVMAGTDSGSPRMAALFWGSGLLVLFLTFYRILAGKGAARRRKAA
ncbi:MAG: hypothetical protein HF973_08540 [Chloroflexi bacterium]|nr:hypothetical protein [Chloroflexota bacterium]